MKAADIPVGTFYSHRTPRVSFFWQIAFIWEVPILSLVLWFQPW